MKKEILIVEDDKDLAEVAVDYLTDQGLGCVWAGSAEEAEECLYEYPIRLIVLDINLPGMNGFRFCERLRRETEVPVIFISARTSDTDKVNALMLGGDDYLAKPYSLVELYSRIIALMRRAYGYSRNQKLEFGDIAIDQMSRSVTKRGLAVEMTAKMYDLLVYLYRHPGEVLSKEKLFTEIWGYGSESSISVLPVHIRWLRERVEANPAQPVHILTVHGKGYRFER